MVNGTGNRKVPGTLPIVGANFLKDPTILFGGLTGYLAWNAFDR